MFLLFNVPQCKNVGLYQETWGLAGEIAELSALWGANSQFSRPVYMIFKKRILS